ncbi:MAG: hypothetical protein HKO89_05360 [Saprospiraceae bacterium]|nr:hypothetical protein [Saprospiraceae bacterium]
MKLDLYYIAVFTCIIYLSLFSACSIAPSNNAPDVSGIQLDGFSFTRFDREVASLDTNNIQSSYEEMMKRQPYITELYFEKLLSFPSDNEDSLYHYISQFLQAESIARLNDTIGHLFEGTAEIENDLQKGCQYLKYYFPEYQTPHFYTFQTEFGYQVVIFSDGERDGIGLGLDYFLGEDFDYKLIDPRNPVFSDYMIRTYNRDHIVKRAFDVIVEDLVGDPPGKRFIDLMIHEGKKMYLLDQLLPHLSDTVISGFSEDQLKWLNQNELEMWSFFIDKEMIYNTNLNNNMKYLSPAPNSQGMPPQAPGRTACYMGWQIVDAFMRRQQDFKLPDLLNYMDSQKLMELSRYKPPRR